MKFKKLTYRGVFCRIYPFLAAIDVCDYDNFRKNTIRTAQEISQGFKKKSKGNNDNSLLNPARQQFWVLPIEKFKIKSDIL